MPNYAVFLHGENYPLKVDGKSQLFGFFVTTRFETNTKEKSAKFAIESLRSDPELVFFKLKHRSTKSTIGAKVEHDLLATNKLKTTKYQFYAMDEK